jgi:hypothetical protein
MELTTSDAQRLSKGRLLLPAAWGVAGGALGFLGSRLVDLDNATDASDAKIAAGFWFMLALGGIGTALITSVAWSTGRRPTTSAGAVSVVALVVGGFAAGYIAQQIYVSMLDTGALQACFAEYRSNRDDSALNWCFANTVRLPRAVGWLIAGAIGGIGIGAAFGSKRHVQNSVAGGAIGGLLGGLLFDTVPAVTGASSLAVSQLISLCVIGGLIGAASSLIEIARASLWLEIQSGEMTGRQLVVVDDVARLGSARTIELPIAGDRQVSEIHLTIRTNADEPSFEAHAPTALNGTASPGAILHHGDVLTVGSTNLMVMRRGTPSRSAIVDSGPPPQQRVRLTASASVAASSPQSPQAPTPPSTTAVPARPSGTASPPPPPPTPAPAPPAAPQGRPRLPTKPPL